jgi:hypothetical protein
VGFASWVELEDTVDMEDLFVKRHCCVGQVRVAEETDRVINSTSTRPLRPAIGSLGR